jgi:hypothetical protein
LPSDLCRAAAHDKGFVVHMGFFAVQLLARQQAVFP